MTQMAPAKSRPAKPDVWLTIAGWIWVAYALGVLALLVRTAA
jgi:hypothetical protein